YLSLIRGRVAPRPRPGAASAAHPQRYDAETEVRLAGAALGRRHLDSRATVRQQHARLRLLELEAAGHGATDRSDGGSASTEEGTDRAQPAADAPRVVLGEGHGGREDVVSRHHL